MSPRRLFQYCFFLGNLALALGLMVGYNRVPLQGALARPTIEQVSISEVAKYLESGDVFFVDARPTEAHKRTRLPGAGSLPMGERPSPALLDKLRRAPRVVVYCDGPDCRAAEEVATMLVLMKFENVQFMKEGMNAWLESGLPVDRAPE